MSDDTTNAQAAAETPDETEQPPMAVFEFAVVVKDEETGEWGEPFGDIGDTMHDAFIVAGALGGEVVARQVGPWGIVQLPANVPDDASSLLSTDTRSPEA